MKICQSLRVKQFLLAMSMLLAGAGSHAVMPQGEFACQVLTAGGNYALKLIQSDTMDEAIATAKNRRVKVTDQVWADVVEVVQCIDRSEERFSDPAFQAVYENTPL